MKNKFKLTAVIILLVCAGPIFLRAVPVIPDMSKKLESAVSQNTSYLEKSVLSKGKKTPAFEAALIYRYLLSDDNVLAEYFYKAYKPDLTDEALTLITSASVEFARKVGIKLSEKQGITAVYSNILNENYNAAQMKCFMLIKEHPKSAFYKYLLSRVYTEQGALDKAMIWINQALRADSSSKYFLQKGRIYEYAAKPAAALSVYKKIPLPRSTEAVYSEAAVLLQLGKDKEVRKIVNRAKGMDKSVLYELLAKHCAQNNSYKRALDFAQRTVDAAPFSPRGYIQLAAALDGLNAPLKKWQAEANSLILGKIEYSPVYSVVAGHLIRLKDFALADKLLTAGTQVPSAGNNIFLFSVNYFLQHEKYGQAYTTALAGLKRAPNNSDLLYAAAAAAQKLGKDKEAISYYKQDIEVNKRDKAAYTNLAFLLNGAKDYAQTISLSEQAITYNIDEPELYNQIGRAYFSLKKYEPAADFFNKAISLKPGNLDYIKNIVGLYQAAKDWKNVAVWAKTGLRISALPLFKSALARSYARLKSKTDALMWYKKAVSTSAAPKIFDEFMNFMLNNNFETDALTYEDTYLQLAPDKAQADFVLGQLYNKTGNIDKASHFFAQAVSISPDNPNYLIGNVNVLIAKKQYNTALKNAKKLAKKIPKNAEVYYELSIIYDKLGDNRSALKNIDKTLKYGHKLKYYETALDEFLKHRGADDYETLISDALRRYPNSAALRYKAALLYSKNGKLSRMKEQLKEAVRLQPAKFDYSIALMNLYFRLKEYQSAVNLGKQLMLYFAESPQVFEKISFAYEKLKLYGKALEFNEEAIKLAPDSVQYYIKKMDLLIDSRRYIDAAALGNVIKDSFVNNPGVLYRTGVAYQFMGQYDKADTLFEQALSLKQKKIYYVHLLQIEKVRSKYSALLKTANAALSKFPNEPYFLVSAGLAYIGLENNSAAEKEFKQALKADPNNLDAYLGLAKLNFAKNRSKQAFDYYTKAIELSQKVNNYIEPNIYQDAYINAIKSGYPDAGFDYLDKYIMTGAEDVKALSDYVFLSIKRGAADNALLKLSALKKNKDLSSYYAEKVQKQVSYLKKYMKSSELRAWIKKNLKKTYQLSEILKSGNRSFYTDKYIFTQADFSKKQGGFYLFSEIGTNLQFAVAGADKLKPVKDDTIFLLIKYKKTIKIKNELGVESEYPLFEIENFVR